jgi:hypothetical protein
MLLKRSDGSKLVQKLFDTVYMSERMMLVCLASGRNDTSFGRMEQWIEWCPSGMARISPYG